MSFLNTLPQVNTFFGASLHVGVIIIATASIVHPLAFGCTFCIRFSYIIFTIWILVVLFFITSLLLVFGLVHKEPTLCEVWILYTMVFVVLMWLLLFSLLYVYASRRQTGRVLFVIIGLTYYGLMMYFVFVVNSYCKTFSK